MKLLTTELLEGDTCVVVTTIINSGCSQIRARDADHVIVEEEFTADHGQILTALAHARGTVSMSDDTEQLKQQNEEVKDNCMATCTNMSEFDRWTAIGHPYAEMWEQYRTIPVLSDIISSIWYNNQVIFRVDPKTRPNATRATKFIRKTFNINHPIAFLDVVSEATRVGATWSKQNYLEVKYAIHLAEGLTQSGIKPRDICFLTGYTAQATLFGKMVFSLPGDHKNDQSVKNFNHMTIDKAQGDQWSCVIWSICGETAGFHNNPASGLVAVSRAKDCVIVLGNWIALEGDNPRVTKTLTRIQEAFQDIQAYQDADVGDLNDPDFKRFEDVVDFPDEGGEEFDDPEKAEVEVEDNAEANVEVKNNTDCLLDDTFYAKFECKISDDEVAKEKSDLENAYTPRQDDTDPQVDTILDERRGDAGDNAAFKDAFNGLEGQEPAVQGHHDESDSCPRFDHCRPCGRQLDHHTQLDFQSLERRKVLTSRNKREIRERWRRRRKGVVTARVGQGISTKH